MYTTNLKCSLGDFETEAPIHDIYFEDTPTKRWLYRRRSMSDHLKHDVSRSPVASESPMTPVSSFRKLALKVRSLTDRLSPSKKHTLNRTKVDGSVSSTHKGQKASSFVHSSPCPESRAHSIEASPISVEARPVAECSKNGPTLTGIELGPKIAQDVSLVIPTSPPVTKPVSKDTKSALTLTVIELGPKITMAAASPILTAPLVAAQTKPLSKITKSALTLKAIELGREITQAVALPSPISATDRTESVVIHRPNACIKAKLIAQRLREETATKEEQRMVNFVNKFTEESSPSHINEVRRKRLLRKQMRAASTLGTLEEYIKVRSAHSLLKAC
ncbi:hypothetical protein BJ878DRAFT_300325 [Calycina marina]|uniref:Uncharacterized protein n=1 Tax=Calycina marina TaxID=1763456 RepID=A0A9P8CGV0_9HELO|nr:hypothetical protein BJ878DRAFT_300325 [Calycina marina]